MASVVARMGQSNSVADNEKRATSSPHSRDALSEKAPLSSPHVSKRYNIAKVSSVYDLAALDGLKGAASFVVMAFHALMYWGSILDLQKGYKLLEVVWWLRLVLQAPISLDIYFCLTGLWASWYLVPALEEKGNDTDDKKAREWEIIGKYYRRRILKVLLPYITTLILTFLAVDHSVQTRRPELQPNYSVVYQYCPKPLITNVLLLNNFLGFAGCGVHFWSLAIQLQFYFIFPRLLVWAAPRAPGFQKRVAYGSIIALVSSAIFRWVLAVVFDVQMPLPAYSHPQLTSAEVDRTVRYYHSLYFSTPSRIGNLATGVLLGLVLRNETIGSYLKKHMKQFSIICLAIFSLFYQLVGSKKIFGTPSDSHQWSYPHEFTALAYHGSPLYCLTGAAIIMAISLHAGWLGQCLAKVFSSKIIKHFSNVSYHMYLLHMTAFYWLEKWVLRHDELPSLIKSSPLSGYGVALICLWTSAYVVARLHMVLHEKFLYPSFQSLKFQLPRKK